MPETVPVECHLRFHPAIAEFLHNRLQAKLDKLAPDDSSRPQLVADFERGAWLRSAAKRVMQIQAVTHSLKPIHPDARGTNLYVTPTSLGALDELGSHALGSRFPTDVVGNAAALDVYKLLKIEVGERSFGQALQDNHPDALQALDDDPIIARTLRDAFVSLTAKQGGAFSSDVRAKQVYWLTGNDANNDAQYHLLAPLYPTALVQCVFEELQDARFGDANKGARQARRNGATYVESYREYRDLAVQKMGGTKPQNISQLNSERGGNNYLLSSLPPVWQSRRNFFPVNATSVFERAFGERPSVRTVVSELQAFLDSDPPKNVHTRERVGTLSECLVNELVIYAGELLHRDPGWSLDPEFKELVDEEKLWLDPLRAQLPDEDAFAGGWLFMDWPDKVGDRFGAWLNSQLKDRLPDVGDAESREWRRTLLDGDNRWTQELRQMREQIDASRHVRPRDKSDDPTVSQKKK